MLSVHSTGAAPTPIPNDSSRRSESYVKACFVSMVSQVFDGVWQLMLGAWLRFNEFNEDDDYRFLSLLC